MMPSIAECLAALPPPAPKPPRPDKFKLFYNSRAWRNARYQFLKQQPRPLRCSCCGATAADTKLAVDHIVPLKMDFSRRLEQTNFQVLCAVDCNLAKASTDATDWRLEKERDGEIVR
jgi:5-methylcytosine-specific restriction endonuclease McrA